MKSSLKNVAQLNIFLLGLSNVHQEKIIFTIVLKKIIGNDDGLDLILFMKINTIIVI